MADNFDDIVKGLDITAASAFTYQVLPVSDNAPETIRPNRTVRQWALVNDGKIVALGPATGGGKSAFIKFAAENPGHTVAHRMVTLGEWKVPTD